MLAIEHLVATKCIDCAMLRGSHQPGGRIIRDTRRWPFFESNNERVHRQVFGEADVMNYSSEARDQLWRFDSPHRFDGLVGV